MRVEGTDKQVYDRGEEGTREGSRNSAAKERQGAEGADRIVIGRGETAGKLGRFRAALVDPLPGSPKTAPAAPIETRQIFMSYFLCLECLHAPVFLSVLSAATNSPHVRVACVRAMRLAFSLKTFHCCFLVLNYPSLPLVYTYIVTTPGRKMSSKIYQAGLQRTKFVFPSSSRGVGCWSFGVFCFFSNNMQLIVYNII